MVRDAESVGVTLYARRAWRSLVLLFGIRPVLRPSRKWFFRVIVELAVYVLCHVAISMSKSSASAATSRGTKVRAGTSMVVPPQGVSSWS
jgi:hypothetical protein